MPKKKAVVPRLRFPEFRDSGEWEVKRLGELAYTFLDGDWIESKDQSLDGIRLIQTGNIGLGEFIINDDKARFVSEDTFQRLKCTEVFPGDLVISRLPDPAGRCCLIPHIGKRMITAVDCTIARFDPHLALPYFILSYCQTDQYFHEVRSLSAGSTRHRISRQNLANVRVPTPALPEQQKIADCLTSLDELIELQAKRLDAIKAHKKCLLQQLFPREGEATPRLRFPEFRDAGEWGVRTIEDLAEKIAQGGTPNTGTPEYWNGEIPWITPAEMGDDAAHHYTERTVRMLSFEGLQNSSAEVLPVNSVIISSRAPIGYVTINRVPMATNQGCKGIVPKKGINHEFLYFSLLTAKHRLNDLGAGAGFKEISSATLKKFEFPITDYAEQQKIADCLNSLDELIELQAKKLDALKAHKKGLLQQLFPQEVE